MAFPFSGLVLFGREAGKGGDATRVVEAVNVAQGGEQHPGSCVAQTGNGVEQVTPLAEVRIVVDVLADAPLGRGDLGIEGGEHGVDGGAYGGVGPVQAVFSSAASWRTAGGRSCSHTSSCSIARPDPHLSLGSEGRERGALL